MNATYWLAHPIDALRQSPIRAVEVIAFAIIAILLMAAPASAHDRDGYRDGYRDGRGWEQERGWHEHHHPYRGWGPPAAYYPPPVYVRPRPVIVAPPPVYYAPPRPMIAPAPSFNVVVPLNIR